MKKLASVALVAVALLLFAAVPSDADGRHGGFRGHSGFRGHHISRGGHFRSHVFIGVGPVWWGPSYYYPYYYPPPYYVYSPPPVVVQEPPVYVQQQAVPAPPPPPAPEAQSYWHYCQSAKGYYPTVPSCPEPWLKVAPRPQ